MMKSPIVEHCEICKGKNLQLFENQDHKDVLTGENLCLDLWVCQDCDTIHYFDSEEQICFEFNPSILLRSRKIQNYRKEH